MHIISGTVPKCEIAFDEEKKLIFAIQSKDLTYKHIKNYSTLNKLLERVELNIDKYNEAVGLVWTANFFMNAAKIIKNDNAFFTLKNLQFDFKHSISKRTSYSIEGGQVTCESANLDDAWLKLLNCTNYFKGKSFKTAIEEIIVNYENVYSSAWRVVTFCKEFIEGMRNFKPKGVTYMRNHIMEHPNTQIKRFLSSIVISDDSRVVLTYTESHFDIESNNEVKVDLCINDNLLEFKKNLNRKLSIIEANLDL